MNVVRSAPYRIKYKIQIQNTNINILNIKLHLHYILYTLALQIAHSIIDIYHLNDFNHLNI